MTSAIVPLPSAGLVRRESRVASRALARLEAETQLKLAEIEQVAEIQAGKADAIFSVGRRVMHGVALTSQVEQQLGALVPFAATKLQDLSNIISLVAAEVVLDTPRRLPR